MGVRGVVSVGWGRGRAQGAVGVLRRSEKQTVAAVPARGGFETLFSLHFFFGILLPNSTASLHFFLLLSTFGARISIFHRRESDTHTAPVASTTTGEAGVVSFVVGALCVYSKKAGMVGGGRL